MIRVKISNFIKKHKYKIYEFGKKMIMVAMIVFIATIVMSSLSTFKSDDKTDKSNTYKPTQTVIQGSDISKEQYEQDSNLVNKFLKYCNNKQIEAAYNLLSEECKQEMYPQIDIFKKNYYDFIFSTERECNLQSWISTKEYTIYKVRYTNNMLSTGTYNENDVYQDYLTLKKKNDEEKISIGNFIDFEKLNIVSKTEEIEVVVTKKKTYMTYEEYEMEIKNNMRTTMLLNDLKTGSTMRLITKSGTEYNANINKFFTSDLLVTPGERKKVTIRFKKNFNINQESDRIEIVNIIKDYDIYTKSKEEYTDTTKITIDVRG